MSRTLVSTALPEWRLGCRVAGSEGAAPGILSPAELARMANEIFNALAGGAAAACSYSGQCGAAAQLRLHRKSLSRQCPARLRPLRREFCEPGRSAAGSIRRYSGEKRCAGCAVVRFRGACGSGRWNCTAAAVCLPSRCAAAVSRACRGACATADSCACKRTARCPVTRDLHAIPFSLLSDLQPSRPAETPQPPAPAVPGAFGVVDSSAVPAFSFMEDARPLFSTPPADSRTGSGRSRERIIPPVMPSLCVAAGSERASATWSSNSRAGFPRAGFIRSAEPAAAARSGKCCTGGGSRLWTVRIAGRSRPLFVFIRRGGDSPRFSDSARAGQRPSADLARQRRNHAEAAIGHRPPELLLRTRKLECASCRA